MRGRMIFLVFFLTFAVASYIIPPPLFPASMIHNLLSTEFAQYFNLMDSIVNGIVYGIIVWLVYVIITRKPEEP